MSRRRQYVIDRKYQFRFAATGALYIACVWAAVAAVGSPLIDSINTLLGDAPTSTAVAVKDQVRNAKIVFFVAAFITTVVSFVGALLRAHRIAGPAYNILRILQRVREGDTTARIRLRKGDDLHAVADGINDVLDSLQHRDESIRERIRDLAWSGEGPLDRIPDLDRAVSFVLNKGNSSGKHVLPDYVKPSGPPRVPERV